MLEKSKIIYSPECLEYKDEGHPESPSRVASAVEYLAAKGYEFAGPKPATEADVLLVHGRDLVDRVKSGQFFESDTPSLPNIYDYALLSVGSAIMASQLALSGESAFSLMRPPGHHAGVRKLGGFCYFNNIAVAAKKLIDQGKRVAIVDIDCHHGNGTQEIFLGQENIIYLSLHQGGIYPNTGYESEDNCYNFPLEADISEKDYLKILDTSLAEVKKFKPDVLAVSAGFDAYKHDPLTGMNLGLDIFTEIGRKIGELQVPIFTTLEGGYSKDLGQCIYNLLAGLEA